MKSCQAGLWRRAALAAILAAGLPVLAGAEQSGSELSSQPWHRHLTSWMRPAWSRVTTPWKNLKPFWVDEESGSYSAYAPNPGRRGMIFRRSREAPPIEGLPRPSPELAAPGFAWSLETAISRSLVANPKIMEARLLLARQGGVEMEARSRLYPQVGLAGSAERRDDRLIDRSTSELSLTPDKRTALADRSYDLRLEIKQMLMDGGGASNAYKRQQVQTTLQRVNLQLEAYRTVTLIKQAYDAVHYKALAVESALRLEQSLQQITDFTERRYKAGVQPQLEYFRAAAILKEAQAAQWKARGNLTQARLYLARQLYLPTQAGSEPDFVLLGELAPREFTLSPEEAVQLALERRLDLYSAKLQVKAAEYTLKAVRGSAYPSVEAFANFGYRSSYYDYERHLDGWTRGVSVRQNVFDGFAHRGRMQAYRADQQVAQVRLDDIDVQVRINLAELFSDLAMGKAALASQKEAMNLAETSVKDARIAYERGHASLEQVLEAENSRLRIQNAHAEAIAALNATVAQLEFGIGGVIPGGRDVGVEVLP